MGLFSRLEDGRILVGPQDPPLYLSRRNLCLPLEGSADLMLLRPDIDWKSLAHYARDYVRTVDGNLLSDQMSLTPLGPKHRIRPFDSSGDWLAFAPVRDYEYLGMKRDGSLWYWNEANEAAGAKGRMVDGHLVRPQSHLKIPFRFRPRKLGHLEL